MRWAWRKLRNLLYNIYLSNHIIEYVKVTVSFFFVYIYKTIFYKASQSKMQYNFESVEKKLKDNKQSKSKVFSTCDSMQSTKMRTIQYSSLLERWCAVSQFSKRMYVARMLPNVTLIYTEWLRKGCAYNLLLMRIKMNYI